MPDMNVMPTIESWAKGLRNVLLLPFAMVFWGMSQTRRYFRLATGYSRTLWGLLLFNVLFLTLLMIIGGLKVSVMHFSCALIGAVFGFLFGVPQLSYAEELQKTTRVNLTNNLLAVADWLVKGITVLSLVSLKPIVNEVYRAASDFDHSLGASLGAQFIALIMVASGVLGFAYAYLWVTFEFAPALRSQEALATSNEQDKSQIEAKIGNPARFRAEGQAYGWDADTFESDPLADDLQWYTSADDQLVLGLLGDPVVEQEDGLRFYRIHIGVRRLDAEPFAESDSADFLLHPTYGDRNTANRAKPYVVRVGADRDGRISLRLTAIEGFVLGANMMLNGRQHQLRLDLNRRLPDLNKAAERAPEN